MAYVARMTSRIYGLRYGRNVRSYGRRVGLSYQFLDSLIKVWKLVLAPLEYVKRLGAARTLLSRTQPPVRMPEDRAFALFTRKSFSGIDPVIDECEALYASITPTIDLSNPKNRFRHNLLTKENLESQKAILDFVLSEELVASAAAYLGTIPVLGSVQLWWTPVNELLESSQLYHIDQIDRRQYKMFLNIRKVTDDAGPLTFLPGDVSHKVYRSVQDPYSSVPDKTVFQHCTVADEVAITGEAGEGGIVDSSRCYHYGGRARKDERLVLMVQYFPFHCVKETSDVQWQSLVERIRKNYRGKAEYIDMLLTLPPSPFLPSIKN